MNLLLVGITETPIYATATNIRCFDGLTMTYDRLMGYVGIAFAAIVGLGLLFQWLSK